MRKSIPGVGRQTAATMLAGLLPFDRLPSAGSAAAYGGRAPREFQSGTSVKRRTGLSTAGIATARKLVTIAYLMLKHNEPYRYAQPDVVKNKLTDCRRKAMTGPGRTEGESDGSRLNDLYREHGLPACQPPASWSEGERRGHGDPAVTAFAEEAHRPPAKMPRSKRRVSTTSE